MKTTVYTVYQEEFATSPPVLYRAEVRVCGRMAKFAEPHRAWGYAPSVPLCGLHLTPEAATETWRDGMSREADYHEDKAAKIRMVASGFPRRQWEICADAAEGV